MERIGEEQGDYQKRWHTQDEIAAAAFNSIQRASPPPQTTNTLSHTHHTRAAAAAAAAAGWLRPHCLRGNISRHTKGEQEERPKKGQEWSSGPHVKRLVRVSENVSMKKVLPLLLLVTVPL